jgi:homoserine dehydrogenase
VDLDLTLVGFGHVGRRFVRLLEERRAILHQEYGLLPRVVGIATARHGIVFDPAGVDACDAARAVEAGRPVDEGRETGAGNSLELIARLHELGARAPQVVVETTVLDIRGGGEAVRHVRAALAAGAHVITANKGPAAFAYHELHALAQAAGVSFLFEGAVMDGIPVFNLVRETLPAVKVDGFRGVVNTTTNHILAALEEGQPFDEALARMQAEGIAEADPSLDLDGWDAAAKTAALANVLMDARITPDGIPRDAISAGTAGAVRAARARGRRVKLVASAERRGDSVTARVALRELPPSDLLAGLGGLANAIVFETDLAGELAIVQGAGNLTQTAYALVSDLVTVARRLRARRAEPARRSL